MLAVGMALAGVIAIAVGIILHTVARRFQDVDAQMQAIADELERIHQTGRP
jgi:hypothetical protein